MFPAVCSDCGKETSVPFEPRQGRPVYCSDCYRKVRDNKY
jgi:CxxC-x17-CxxC domain-containing protein